MMSVRMCAALLVVGAGGCGRTPLFPGDGDGGWSGGRYEGGQGHNDGGDDRGGSDQPCRNVSFLFVVDNSPTMGMYQSKLLANYEVFIDGIQEAVESIETTHVGVVTAEAYPHNPRGCDHVGGLVTQTGGPGSSDRVCGPFSEGNYISDRDPLDSLFRCIAQVGVGGSDRDTPLAAALAAVSPPLTDEGNCNHGFFTPGDLLVLVIITDTLRGSLDSPGTILDLDPYFVSAGLGTMVGGSDDIVVVVIASTEDSVCQIPLAPELADFAKLYKHSFIGALCEDNYADIFEPAVEVVKNACPM